MDCSGNEKSLNCVMRARSSQLKIRAALTAEAESCVCSAQESLVISRELGDDWGIAQFLNYLGFVALLRDVHERTAEVLRAGREYVRDSG